MGAAASRTSQHTAPTTAGTQHKQQANPRKQHQQQQDWASALGLVLAHISESDGVAVAQCHAERALHRVNKQLRAAACATVRHLSLWPYHLGREEARQAWHRTGTFSAALAAAAADPPIPWALLATTPCLTSLEVVGSQVPQLTAGGSIPGAAEGQICTSQVLAATLARLQCLGVNHISDELDLRHLGWMLGHCPHLTKLALAGLSTHSINLFTEGLEMGAAAAAAASPAAAAAQGTAAAGAAGSRRTSPQLPALKHLELSGSGVWLATTLLSLPGVATQVTTVHLGGVAAWTDSWSVVASCSGLRELRLDFFAEHAPLELPQELSNLTALTKLVLREAPFTELPAVVCSLKQLRTLNLCTCRNLSEIPSSISQLQQLQELDVSHTRMEQLPEELGTWLPQLEGLEVGVEGLPPPALPAIPKSLTRLTRLGTVISVTQASAVQHLVSLKHLKLCRLDPPFQPLSRLAALETLSFYWTCQVSEQEAAAVCIPGPLPNLRSLTFSAGTAIPAGGLQVLVGAQQLTHLSMEGPSASDPGSDRLAALWQVGVLPQLQELVITARHSSRCAVLCDTALAWLQRQPRVTSLRMAGFKLEASQLEQLPCQLEILEVDDCTLVDDQLGVLTHLTRLHTLKLPHVQRVPPWLPRLVRLEVLHLRIHSFQQEDPCWELLTQLPLLRVVNERDARLFVPHLCWGRWDSRWRRDMPF